MQPETHSGGTLRGILMLLVTAVAAFVLTGMPLVARAADVGEPTLSEAQAAIICDQAGNVLYSKNADQELPMASITKIMTAMVALDSGKSMDDVCTITDPQLDGTAQQAGYTTTDTPTFRELMMAMLVFSANDAAYNVATNVAGSEEAFVDLMNQKAQELGMTHTHFSNSHGLEEDDHYSCAQDLVTMGRYALSHYPFIAQAVITRTTTVHVNGTEVVLGSTDALVGSYAGMRGIKTGAYSEGYTFLGACERDNVQLFTCVLGCATNSGRFADTQAMLDWAYGNYRELEPVQASTIVSVRPYLYSFALKAVVSSSTDAGEVWPAGGDVTYTTVRSKSGRMFDVDDYVGTTTWYQDGRTLGWTVQTTRDVPVEVDSWPPYVLGLFYDTSTLGRRAS